MVVQVIGSAISQSAGILVAVVTLVAVVVLVATVILAAVVSRREALLVAVGVLPLVPVATEEAAPVEDAGQHLRVAKTVREVPWGPRCENRKPCSEIYPVVFEVKQ